YRIPALAQATSVGPALCDLSGLHHGLGPLCEATGRGIERPGKGRGSRPGSASPIYSVPYYLNPSFLVARKEFIPCLRSRSEDGVARRIVEGKGDYTWLEVFAAAEQFLQGVQGEEQWKGHVPFDCPQEPGENLNCLFLEVLASLAGGAGAVN